MDHNDQEDINYTFEDAMRELDELAERLEADQLPEGIQAAPSQPARSKTNTSESYESINAIDHEYQKRVQIVQPTSLVSFPRSVEQNLIANSRPNQAVNTLATTNPELAAILVAKQLGYNEITVEDKDVTTTSILRKRAWIFGGDYWKDGESTTRTRTRKIKLT